MRIRILGAHQGESRDTRFMSILIDGQLAIDAGGLTSSLTVEEQLRIEAVLITHQHFDHVKDLPPLAHNLWDSKPTRLYCTEHTCRMIREHIFNDLLWPAMRAEDEGHYPLVYNTVEPGRAFDLLGYSILPIEMPHTVPAVGYCVEHGGKRVFYTADTSGHGDPPWAVLPLDLLIAETTYSSQFTEVAARFGHMTPQSLERELRAFHARQGYYPRVVCVHINVAHEAQVHEELAALAQDLGADIQPAYEGMELEA
jgi:cAMP phosphodiesterase